MRVSHQIATRGIITDGNNFHEAKFILLEKIQCRPFARGKKIKNKSNSDAGSTLWYWHCEMEKSNSLWDIDVEKDNKLYTCQRD